MERRTDVERATCPSCRVELAASDYAEAVADHPRSGKFPEGWVGECETLNCYHAGRRTGLTTLFLVVEGEQRHDDDVAREVAEPIGYLTDDGHVYLNNHLGS